MAKKHNMTTKPEFDNHSNQLNPNHTEWQKVHSTHKTSSGTKGNQANSSKGGGNSGSKK